MSLSPAPLYTHVPAVEAVQSLLQVQGAAGKGSRNRDQSAVEIAVVEAGEEEERDTQGARGL